MTSTIIFLALIAKTTSFFDTSASIFLSIIDTTPDPFDFRFPALLANALIFVSQGYGSYQCQDHCLREVVV
jgi:hypothetical protein